MGTTAAIVFMLYRPPWFVKGLDEPAALLAFLPVVVSKADILP
jgi:hypothetical protein